MSKYYKVEDVINTLADQWHFEATMEYPDTAGDIEEWKENARELFADLPTIEVSGDCISRKAVEEMLMDSWVDGFEYSGDLIGDLAKMPSVVSTDTNSILYLESREIVNCNDCSEYDTCDFEFIKARNGYCYLGERIEE